MEIIIAAIFEIILELLIQGFFELTMGSSVRRLPTPQVAKNTGPVIKAVFYSLLALLAAWLSVKLIPALYIKNSTLQIINLIVSPFIIAAAISLRTKIVKQEEKFLIKLDEFSFAYLFALIFSVTRYLLAQSH